MQKKISKQTLKCECHRSLFFHVSFKLIFCDLKISELSMLVHFKNSFFCFLFLLFFLLLFLLLFPFFPSFSFLAPFMISILPKFSAAKGTTSWFSRLCGKHRRECCKYMCSLWKCRISQPNCNPLQGKTQSRESKEQNLCYYITQHFNSLEDEEMTSLGKCYVKGQMFPLIEPTGLELCTFHNWQSLYGPFPINPRVAWGTLVTLKDLHLEPWGSEGEEIASMLTLFSVKNKEHHSVSDDLDSSLVPSWPVYQMTLTLAWSLAGQGTHACRPSAKLPMSLMAPASCEHEVGIPGYLGLLCNGPVLAFPGTPGGSKCCSTQNWPQSGTAQCWSIGTLAMGPSEEL